MATQPQAASTVCQNPVSLASANHRWRASSTAARRSSSKRVGSHPGFNLPAKSRRVQQNDSILAYMNCKEFPMKFPRVWKFPQLWRLSHILSNCCEMVGFSGGQGGPPERFSAAHGNVSLHHQEGRSPSWNLRSEEVDFSRIKKYGRTQSRANNDSFRLKKKKSPFMQECHSKPWWVRIH